MVINGARPSSKAETIDVTLARIPAQRVVRVEVGPGDLYGSDYAGKSQVLNIILSGQGGIDANVTAAARRWYPGYINRDLSGSAVITRGASSINVSAGTGRNKQYEEGTDDLTDVATGELVEHRRKHNIYFNRDPYIAAGWSLERGSDKAFHLNARWQPTRFDLTQRNRVTPADGPQHDDNLFQHYKDPLIELGGDVARPLAGGAIKFVALATRRKRNDFDNYIERDGFIDDGAAVVGGFEQTVKARRNETIGRLSWSRSNLAGLSFEVGAEAAYNTLDYGLEFFEIDENGGRVPIDLPLDNATVKEKRGEVYVSVGKTLSPALRVDGGVNYELSNLRVSGDASAKRALKFLKPNLSVDWKPGGGWHAQASIRRTVAQLDFYDFVSIADLSAQRVNGGNEIWSRSAPGSSGSRPNIRCSATASSSSTSATISSASSRTVSSSATRRMRTSASMLRAISERASATSRRSPWMRLWAASGRSSSEIQRDGSAHPRRRPDQRQAAQLQRLLSRLAVGNRCSPGTRQIFLRIQHQRSRSLHLLPNGRVRPQFQWWSLWHGIHRIPVQSADFAYARRGQCPGDQRQSRPALVQAEPRRACVHLRRIPPS